MYLWSFKQDCSTCKFATITCNLIPSDMTQVNVSLIVWKPTFIKVSDCIILCNYWIMLTSVCSLLVYTKYSASVERTGSVKICGSNLALLNQPNGSHFPCLFVTKISPRCPSRYILLFSVSFTIFFVPLEINTYTVSKFAFILT